MLANTNIMQQEFQMQKFYPTINISYCDFVNCDFTIHLNKECINCTSFYMRNVKAYIIVNRYIRVYFLDIFYMWTLFIFNSEHRKMGNKITGDEWYDH